MHHIILRSSSRVKELLLYHCWQAHPTDCSDLPPTAKITFLRLIKVIQKKLPSTDCNQSVGVFLVKFLSLWEGFFAVGGRSEQSVGYDYSQ